MLRRWWERWPGRLEYELEALRLANIPCERDEQAFHTGTLRLRLRPTIMGETVNLIATFPDFFPYVRFEVEAPDLKLPHHQHPFGKNLCLFGRDTANWDPQDTLAHVILTRLPIVLQAGQSGDPTEVAGLEEQQAEPFSDYYQYQQDAIVLVDGSWVIDPTVRRGELVVGVEPSGALLRGAVLAVTDEQGNLLASAQPALANKYSQQLRGRWLRLSAPVQEVEPEQILKALSGQDGRLVAPQWHYIGQDRLDITAAIFPEEVRWRQAGDGWLFVIRAKGPHAQSAGHRIVTYLARAGYAGPSDLAARTPELTSLSGRCLAVVGLGGLGAPSVLEFARAGVGELRLVDHDFVDAGTIVRWPFGLQFAGMMKTGGLEAFLKANYPYTQVRSWTHKIGAPDAKPPDVEVMAEVLSGVHLLYDASAEVGIQYLLADLAAEQGIPYVCVSTTPGAWGGLVARARSGVTDGCWMCLQHSLMDGSIPLPPLDPNGETQPAGCANPTFTGTGFDVAQVALAGVRLAVQTVLASAPGAYPNVAWDVAVISLRDRDGRMIAPAWETFSLARHPSCPLCLNR